MRLYSLVDLLSCLLHFLSSFPPLFKKGHENWLALNPHIRVLLPWIIAIMILYILFIFFPCYILIVFCCVFLGGPKAACAGCAGFAAFSVLIEKFLDRHDWFSALLLWSNFASINYYKRSDSLSSNLWFLIFIIDIIPLN